MSYVDKKALLQVPGAMAKAGTLKQVTANREAFNASIGHGAPSTPRKQLDGTGGTGDPTISYPVAVGLAKVLGRAGAAGTPYHQGKQPVNYDEDLSAYLLEY